MGKRKEQVISSRKNLEHSSGPRVGVCEGIKGLPVRNSSANRLCVIVRRGKFPTFKYIMTLALGIQSAAIEQNAHFTRRSSLRQHFQLLVSPFELARKSKQFEEEGAAFDVGRIVAQFRTQSLNRVSEVARSV
jgi:hypothetical protein